MAEVGSQTQRYRYIGIAVVTVAVLGWLLAIYFWTTRAQVENELARQVQMVGTAEEIDQRIAQLQAETTDAQTQRDAATSALEQEQRQQEETRERIAAELDEAQNELEATRGRLEQAQAEMADLESQVEEMRAEQEAFEAERAQDDEVLAELDATIADAREEVAATSEELAEVGARLEDARGRESELQARLAELSAELADLTREATDSEQRVQAARLAEAELEQQKVSARAELEEIEAARETLDATVETLTQRRDELASDTEAAEAHMEATQNMVVELTLALAERGEQLAELEGRISEMQQAARSATDQEVSGLAFGTRYAHDQVTAIFDADGMYTMLNRRTGARASGEYELSEGILTLNEADGDLEGVEFPIRCAIEADASGFKLAQTDDESCGALADTTFTRDSP